MVRDVDGDQPHSAIVLAPKSEDVDLALADELRRLPLVEDVPVPLVAEMLLHLGHEVFQHLPVTKLPSVDRRFPVELDDLASDHMPQPRQDK